MLSRRTLQALGAFFVIALALSACGGGLPGNSIATIGGTKITKAQFSHWLPIYAKQDAAQSPGAPTIVPDPPTFTKCIAAYRKALPKPAKGKPKVSDAQIKTQCQTSYNRVRDATVSFLIQSQWLEGETKDKKLTVTDKTVDQQFKTTKQQQYPQESQFQQFLKTSGLTIPDILYRLKLNALSTKLQAMITKGKTTATAAEISQYYNSHKSQFAQPEKRDLLVVLTKTAATANQAKAALQHGQSWKAVVKKYSIDQQSKLTNGLLSGVVKGQEDKALDTAAFAAPTGKLLGPIKGQFGYYVFQVKKITAGTTQSLANATLAIRQQLISQKQQNAVNAYVKTFSKKWKAQTTCRKGFTVKDLCKNAPTAKTSTTATTTTGQ
ncbi:MAG: peptidylprolyl isomerase [Solirubrobacterales bacterium]|nr:peptidylprolyl isomerase [Solirubrobacterales bacterium]